MLFYSRVIDTNIPLEDYVNQAKNHLARVHEGDIIDWDTVSVTTEDKQFEGLTLTVFTLTVESAASLAVTFGDSA